jgi:aerobic-type carbon monoxide dehydrogenase small subunit (CoxS/CutS family)
MPTYSLNVNGVPRTVTADPATPLLWVLRDSLELLGTKFGCGAGFCRACTVHLDGQPTPSCQLPIANAAGKSITTIEGLATGERLHPVQRAWLEEDVPQCGYCQAGQLMAAAVLLAAHPSPTEADLDAAMTPHLCRCGTYQRIRTAVRRAAELMRADLS